MANFALIGVAGFVAERHLRAIRDNGCTLSASMDVSDSVGLLDSFFFDSKFFTEIVPFLEYIKHTDVDYLSVCTPNFLHMSHIKAGLDLDLKVICEKPLVINKEDMKELERISNGNVNCILQLRLDKNVIKLRNSVLANNSFHEVKINYITARGDWYLKSWKGDTLKSGGILYNIGIHLFDMLIWVFGSVISFSVLEASALRARGTLKLKKASVLWLVSVDPRDLGKDLGKGSCREMQVDGIKWDISGNFSNLHTESYKEILRGSGFSPTDVKEGIMLVNELSYYAKKLK